MSSAVSSLTDAGARVAAVHLAPRAAESAGKALVSAYMASSEASRGLQSVQTDHGCKLKL